MTREQLEKVRELGLDVNVVVNNLKFGATFDEACEYSTGKSLEKNSKFIEYDGFDWSGIPNIAFAYDVDEARLRAAYVKHKKNVELAIKDAMNNNYKRPGNEVDYNGRHYMAMTELCRDLDLDIVKMRSYLRNNTVEAAVGLLLEEKRLENEKFVYEGVTYKNFVDTCEKNAISFIDLMKHARRQKVKPELVFKIYMRK